jgi:hypothetical protein
MQREDSRIGPGPTDFRVHRASELVREFIEVNGQYVAQLGRELEVNPTDLQAMQHLIMSGSLSPTELAHRLDISTAAVTSVVDRLVVVPRPASVQRAMGALMPMILGIDRVLDGFDADQQATITSYLERIVETYRARLDPSA